MLDKSELIEFEEKVARLWEEGKINAPIHLSGGNEDQLIEIFKGIEESDYVMCGHRNHYHALLHGVDPDSLLDEILGKSEGRCLGRARSMGFIDHSRHFYSSAIVGGMCAPSVGVAWALKERFSGQHVWCFVGDGALDGGHFWEALQYAEGYDLPIKFVIEDNNRATCTTYPQRYGKKGPLVVLPDSRVMVYKYEPTWPHVGTGKYVQF